MWWLWAILLPIGAITAWLALLRQACRSTSKIYIVASAAMPPLASTYSLLSWYIGVVGYVLPGLEERQQSIIFNIAAGTFWRRPLNWLFAKLYIFSPDTPWTQGLGSSPYFGGCFPSAEIFKYYVMSIINETSVVLLITVGGVFMVARWQSKKNQTVT